MSDERRERYAVAMYGPAAPHHVTEEGWSNVDAAITVADEENAGIRATLRAWTNDRAQVIQELKQALLHRERVEEVVRQERNQALDQLAERNSDVKILRKQLTVLRALIEEPGK